MPNCQFDCLAGCGDESFIVVLSFDMATLDEGELREKLHREGFEHTFVWQDRPGAFYPDHKHDTLTAHIILSGEMQLTMNGASKVFRLGERCDVPEGTVHSAKIGPEGCRYLIGEK